MNTTPTFNEVGVLYSKKYFKEELQMSNSSTSPVQYPLPYKAVDGCLYMEKVKIKEVPSMSVKGKNRDYLIYQRESRPNYSLVRIRGDTGDKGSETA